METIPIYRERLHLYIREKMREAGRRKRQDKRKQKKRGSYEEATRKYE